MPDFPKTPIAAAGITFKWGEWSITATSIQHSRQAPTEIDVTSIASPVFTDKANNKRKIVHRAVDFAVADSGEVTVEYVGPGGFADEHIGSKNALSITGLANAPTGKKAFLTSNSVTAVAGELIKGTCTFRVSSS